MNAVRVNLVHLVVVNFSGSRKRTNLETVSLINSTTQIVLSFQMRDVHV